MSKPGMDAEHACGDCRWYGWRERVTHGVANGTCRHGKRLGERLTLSSYDAACGYFEPWREDNDHQRGR